MNKVTIEYHGMEGTGRTMTEAKADAGRKIKAVLDGSYTSEILSHRGYAILIVRNPHGWDHTTIMDPESGLRTGDLSVGYSSDDREECRNRALDHLAQQTWLESDGDTPPPFLTTRHQQSDFRVWAQFQLRYKEAMRVGYDHWDAHSYAGRDPSKPELQKQVDEKIAASTGDMTPITLADTNTLTLPVAEACPVLESYQELGENGGA